MPSLKQDINTQKRKYDTERSKKDYEAAAIAAVDLAQLYVEGEDYEKSYEYYEKAKVLASKVLKKSDKLCYNEFLAHRCSLEQLCKLYQDDEEKIKESLDAFLEYVKNRVKDPSCKQIALHIAAYTYQTYLKGYDDYLESAKSYALTSLKCLDISSDKIDEILKKRYNKYQFEGDDSHRRRAGTYQLLASIADEAGDAKDAEEYCNKAMEFERLEKDPIFHHTVLSTQRDYVPRERRYEISKKMLEVLTKMDAKDRDAQLLETTFIYAEDCLARKDLAEADKSFWKVYNSKINAGGNGRQWKQDAKKALIKLYKIKKRIEEVQKLERIQPLDYQKLAKMYDKIGDAAFDATAYELAIEYYSKMKDAAALIPGDPEYGDLELSRGAMTSLAETFNTELNDYKKALPYFEDLYKIEIRLSCSSAELAESRLNIAMVKKECECFTYEEKKEAFEKVKMPNNNTVLYAKYLEHYIYFLKKHKNKAGVTSLINDLSLELSKYKELQSDSQTSTDTTIRQSFQDKYDLLSDNEIFEKVKEYYEMEKDIEEKRRKIGKKNKNGENLLHEAAKKDLKEVKFLIEKCGYGAVINARDHGNWTPLSEAVNYGHADIVEYLISKGAKVDSISNEALVGEDNEKCSGARQTPLMEACASGYYEIICVLIRNHADACKTNENGWTAGDYLNQFINLHQLKNKQRDQYEYILKYLREEEVKGGIQNRQKKALDLPEERQKKPVPKMPKIRVQEPGVRMFQEALAAVGRKAPLRSIATPQANGVKDENDDKMLEDDDDFIAPESDEDMNGIGDDEEDSEEAMGVDDYNFRQNNGFASSTPTRRKTASPKKRRSNRAAKAIVLDDDDESDVENIVAENSDDDDILMLPQESTPKNEINERKRKSETLLKRRSSNRSFDSSSSSKKTKRSTSLTKKCSNLSKSSSSVNASVIEAVDSLSLLPQQYPSTRINVDSKELDLSFSENITEVSTKLKLHLNLYRLCLKGSDFDDENGIDELVDAICSCHKLVELDLSQIEQIQSIHANKILKSCLKLKVLDLFGTSVAVLDLQNKYILEKLVIAKTPFEYSDIFYQQINELPTLSYLDVSHTSCDLISLLSKLTSTRTKLLQIKACPLSSYLEHYQFTQAIENMGQQNVKLKLPRNTKEEILRINSTFNQFLE